MLVVELVHGQEPRLPLGALVASGGAEPGAREHLRKMCLVVPAVEFLLCAFGC